MEENDKKVALQRGKVAFLLKITDCRLVAR